MSSSTVYYILFNPTSFFYIFIFITFLGQSDFLLLKLKWKDVWVRKELKELLLQAAAVASKAPAGVMWKKDWVSCLPTDLTGILLMTLS